MNKLSNADMDVLCDRNASKNEETQECVELISSARKSRLLPLASNSIQSIQLEDNPSPSTSSHASAQLSPTSLIVSTFQNAGISSDILSFRSIPPKPKVNLSFQTKFDKRYYKKIRTGTIEAVCCACKCQFAKYRVPCCTDLFFCSKECYLYVTNNHISHCPNNDRKNNNVNYNENKTGNNDPKKRKKQKVKAATENLNFHQEELKSTQNVHLSCIEEKQKGCGHHNVCFLSQNNDPSCDRNCFKIHENNDNQNITSYTDNNSERDWGDHHACSNENRDNNHNVKKEKNNPSAANRSNIENKTGRNPCYISVRQILENVLNEREKKKLRTNKIVRKKIMKNTFAQIAVARLSSQARYRDAISLLSTYKEDTAFLDLCDTIMDVILDDSIAN